jgi:four helix bundle protein
MLRLELQRLENEEIERALDEVDGLDEALPVIIDTSITAVLSIIKTFKDLGAWQRARELRLKVIVLSKRPMIRNDPKLRDQLREASRSASRNIAEGFARFTHKDFAHFARIAKASEVELIDHFHEAFDSGYITAEEQRDHKHAARKALKAVIGLIRYLESAPDKSAKK